MVVSWSYLHRYLHKSESPASPLPRPLLVGSLDAFVSGLPAISSCVLSLPFEFIAVVLLLFLRVLVLGLSLRVVLLVLGRSTPSRSSYVLLLPALLLQSPPLVSASVVQSYAGCVRAASALHTRVVWDMAT